MLDQTKCKGKKLKTAVPNSHSFSC
jgi:hypothetical protein